MTEQRTYHVISPVEYGGVITKSGTVSLPDDVAKRLLNLPQPPIADPDATPQSEGSDAAKKSSPGTGAGTGGGVTQEQIVEAIGQLEPGNEQHWTKGNKPEIKALENLLGTAPTAAERDEAWKIYQASN